MGMAAGQARLLSITARLSDNEHTAQSLSYTKQRLADETDQVNAAYNAALEATKLTVLTSFNGSGASYEDISYNLMTGYNTVSCGKQYVVTDNQGKILVSDAIAKAFETGRTGSGVARTNGTTSVDFNKFLSAFGYSQVDVDFSGISGTSAEALKKEKEELVHQAWDKYFVSIGSSLDAHNESDYDETILNFGWDDNGFPTLSKTCNNYMSIPAGIINYNGGTYTLEPKTNGRFDDDRLDTSSYGKQDVAIYDATLRDEENEILLQYFRYLKDKDNNEFDMNLLDNLQGTIRIDPKGGAAGTEKYSNIESVGKKISDFKTKFEGMSKEDLEDFLDKNYVHTISESQGYYLRTEKQEMLMPKYKFKEADGTEHTVTFKTTLGSGNYALQGTSIYYPMACYVDDDNKVDNCEVQYGQKDFSINNCSALTLTGMKSVLLNSETTKADPINFDGTTQEQRELYDYAVALTEAFNNFVASNTATISGTTPYQDPEVTNKIAYYRNIYNQMLTCGYYTEANEADTIKDSKWFEEQLKKGNLMLKYYSAVDKNFVQTSITEDDAIQEVKDDRQLGMIEAKYTQDIAAIEKKDQKIDLELKKLDSEHSALQTEYDSVKSVIDKNVEKTFNIFS